MISLFPPLVPTPPLDVALHEAGWKADAGVIQTLFATQYAARSHIRSHRNTTITVVVLWVLVFGLKSTRQACMRILSYPAILDRIVSTYAGCYVRKTNSRASKLLFGGDLRQSCKP